MALLRIKINKKQFPYFSTCVKHREESGLATNGKSDPDPDRHQDHADPQHSTY
jgi:hypothetical protein